MANQYDSGAYTRGFLLGTIVGGAVGALTALLFAPKSGEEFRRDIADRSGKIYDQASDYFADVNENVGTAVSSTVNQGRLRAEGIINNARKQAEDILRNAENILYEARTKATTAKDQVQGKIDNLRDAAKASAEAFKTEMNASKTDQPE